MSAFLHGGTDFPFSGRLINNVGHGYSPLDAYGFINAEKAAGASVPLAGVVSRKVDGSAPPQLGAVVRLGSLLNCNEINVAY